MRLMMSTSSFFAVSCSSLMIVLVVCWMVSRASSILCCLSARSFCLVLRSFVRVFVRSSW